MSRAIHGSRSESTEQCAGFQFQTQLSLVREKTIVKRYQEGKAIVQRIILKSDFPVTAFPLVPLA